MLAVSCLLFDVRRMLLFFLFVDFGLLIVDCYLSCVVCCLLLCVVCCSVFVICCLLCDV